MKCPLDQTQLVLADKQGIEIDYCPACRGVWLDRGELDKLIERSASFSSQRPQRDDYHRDDEDEYRERRHHSEDNHRHEDNHHEQQGKHRKKESFLGDLFDF